jgi:hypothetical protein
MTAFSLVDLVPESILRATADRVFRSNTATLGSPPEGVFFARRYLLHRMRIHDELQALTPWQTLSQHLFRPACAQVHVADPAAPGFR